MKAAVDLHIHSCLSPCAEKDMTPNNIVNMALLKGLDFIAITDHNSVGNFRSVSLCAEGKGLIAVPGMELETKEEVHVICLFEDHGKALLMQEEVYRNLPAIPNRPDIFGEQILMDEEDNETGRIDRMLLTATNISLEKAVEMVMSLGGAAIPAHIDRESYSLLSNLGIIPENVNLKFMEISRNCDIKGFRERNPGLAGYELIKSSDAHDLGSILEQESFIELEEKSIKALLKKLRC